MKQIIRTVAIVAAVVAAAPASATLITFDNLTTGTVLSTQYAAQGVTFTTNAFTGAGGPTGSWATNTDMTIVTATGSDVGGLGTPSLVSGNLLRSFNGWLNENGDASFRINFITSVNAVSLDFAGIAAPRSTRIFAYNGTTLLGTVVSTTSTGQQRLSFSAPTITSLVVTPGDFNDWVGVDNLNFTQNAGAVPEPATWGLMVVGFGLVGAGVRRRKTTTSFSFA